jgi:hypothetical protein
VQLGNLSEEGRRLGTKISECHRLYTGKIGVAYSAGVGVNANQFCVRTQYSVLSPYRVCPIYTNDTQKFSLLAAFVARFGFHQCFRYPSGIRVAIR